MQVLSAALTLLNIILVVGPIAGVIVIHSSNPIEIVIPAEVQKATQESIDSIESTFESLELVDYTYDLDARTLTLTFSITNYLDIDITFNALEADVQCARDGYPLGHIALNNPVTINSGRSAYISSSFKWTAQAEEHVKTVHAEETSIDIDLVNIALDVSGIVVQTPEHVTLTNIPLPE
jgi:hypothetical protein